MAFTFLRALGGETGSSLVEAGLVPVAKQILADAAARKVEVLLPEDAVAAMHLGDRHRVVTCPASRIPLALAGFDVGPATIARFRAALGDAGTVVWIGPMGMCEIPDFATGTTELAKAVAASPGLTVAGGRDTVAAIGRAGVAGKFGYLSMAGGAFLEYLEGRELPGVAALSDAEPARRGPDPG